MAEFGLELGVNLLREIAFFLGLNILILIIKFGNKIIILLYYKLIMSGDKNFIILSTSE
jgi:hypothetical protein